MRTHYLLNSNSKRYSRESSVSFIDYRTTSSHLHRGIYTTLRTRHARSHVQQAELRSFVHQAVCGGYRIVMVKASKEGVTPPIHMGGAMCRAIAVYYQNTAAFALRRLTKQ